MNLTEMERLQAANVRPVVSQVITALMPYQNMPVSVSMWYQLLQLLYTIVAPAAERSAMISRDYYDAKRAEAGLPQHLIPLSNLSYEKFVKDMSEIRKDLFAPETSAEAIHRAAMRAARSVENSGRWTIMRATEYEDPAFDESGPGSQRARGPNGVRGWARMATGAETCGWCWMLVSRGPVYRDAGTAGSRLSDRDSLQMVGSQTFDAAEHMTQWHTGCDCKIVPVFDLENWDGRDRYLAAEELWKKTSKNATSNKDAINAYRRAVEAGEIQEMISQPLAA